MKKVEEKILGYAHKLMVEQYDRYCAGFKNDWENAKQAYDRLKDFYEGTVTPEMADKVLHDIWRKLQ